MKTLSTTFFLVFAIFALNSQINIERLGKDAAEALINDGDIVLSHSSEFVEKKKKEIKIKEIDPSKPLFLTISLNRKVSSHEAFQNDNGIPYTYLIISTEDGKSTSFQVRFTAEDASRKFANTELASEKLVSSNEIHAKLAKFIGILPAGTHTLNFSIDGYAKIKANVKIDCSNGTGIYGSLLKEIETEKIERAEKERIAKEEEEKMRTTELNAYKSAKDIVKLSFMNKGQYQGSITIETGNKYTSQYFQVGIGKKSENITCRPGDKIYVGNELIHTVVASSNNKVIDISPKRPVTAVNCQGSKRISVVHIENKTGRYLRFKIAGDGFSGGGSCLPSGSGHITCCPYGYELEINVIDEGNAQENYSNYVPYIIITQNHEGQTIVVE